MSSILIVEDERLVARDIEESLRHLGYDIAGSVASGEEALRCANESRPDLVLMDIHIQGSIDGIQTAELLRRKFDSAIVYVTAYADKETVGRAKQTEPFGYIVKPLRMSDVHTAVEVALFKHKVESRVREREHWFSTTLRSIGDAVIAVDEGGHMTFINHSAEVTLGLRSDELLGKRFCDTFAVVDETTKEPIEDPIDRALGGDMVTLPRNAALAGPSGERSIEDSAAPIVDESGKLLGAVIVFRDVAEKRKMERQLAMNDRLASLGTLAAGVAHEINNPLSYIVANGSFVAEEISALREGATNGTAIAGKDFDEAITAVRDLLHGSERVRQIVADLRSFGHPDDGASTFIDPVVALEWAIRITERQIRHRARLVSEIAPLPNLLGNETRLGQVFVNLLTNAAHAVDGVDGPHTITVTTYVRQDGHAEIAIADTGCGMDEKTQARIFEPFFTTKPVGVGSGLGLSVCHGIVQAMGGQISVESQLGRGTTFFVRLPVPDLDRKAGTRTVAAVSEPVHGRVLIIDDEPLVLRALSRVASKQHAVEALTSAREALELLAQDQNFDLIVCDLMMPDLTGMDLYARLQKDFPHLAPRIVFLTGGAFVPRAEEFLALVPNPHLMKPIRPNELLESLQTRLKQLKGRGVTDQSSEH